MLNKFINRHEHVIQRKVYAMATLFEWQILGDDTSQLRALAQMVEDEIERIEGLLSRYDPQAEIYRINQEAYNRPVKIGRELCDILQDCLRWYDTTNGYFDIAYGNAKIGTLSERFSLDARHQTVRFLHPSTTLDLGGYGKGYALEMIGRLLDSYEITSYFLHGGMSSAKAKGTCKGKPWQIYYHDDLDTHSLILTNNCFSCSKNLDADQQDVICDPSLDESTYYTEACYVLSPNAIEAEVLSTALVAMGGVKAHNFVQRYKMATKNTIWIATPHIV